MATIEDMEELVFGCSAAPVWLPKNMLEDKRKTGDTFYCPNGHGRHFKETTAEKLQRKLDATEKVLSEKSQKLEGVKRGKCPFCWKTLKNLSEHIERFHK